MKCVLLVQLFLVSVVSAIQWDHSINVDENYRLLWNVQAQEITFEVQVRTLGYIGFGLSRDGTRSGADVALGWVDHGKAIFQVSYNFKYINDKSEKRKTNSFMIKINQFEINS